MLDVDAVPPLAQPIAAKINAPKRRTPFKTTVLRSRPPKNPKKINAARPMLACDMFKVDDCGVSLRAVGTLPMAVRFPLFPLIAPLVQLVELV